jgi:hypothetical protein
VSSSGAGQSVSPYAFVERHEMGDAAACLRALADDLDRRVREAKFGRISLAGDFADASEMLPTVEQRKAIFEVLGVKLG